MDYFVADTHFGHEKVSAARGFSSVEEMDALLMTRWNERVTRRDTVWIVGDLMCHNRRPAEEYLAGLNGQKRLAIGNHDRVWMRSVQLEKWFHDVGFVLEGGFGKTFFTVSHYPMMDWYRRRHGAYQIYGHIHDHTTDPYYEYLQTVPRAFNAGVDVNGFRPVTLSELIENTADYRRREAVRQPLSEGGLQ